MRLVCWREPSETMVNRWVSYGAEMLRLRVGVWEKCCLDLG